jgi:acetoin utilization protein AcuB
VTNARDLLRPCPTVAETDKVSDVVRRLAAGEGPAFAVLNASGRLEGIVTEHDFVKLIYRSEDYEFQTGVIGGLPMYLGMAPEQLRDLPVGDIMTNDPQTVAPGTSLDDVTEAMVQNRRKVLLVVEHGSVLGIICRTDLIQKVLG